MAGDTSRKNLPHTKMSADERKAAARKARAMIRWPAHPYARKYQTPEEMEKGVREYFETCASIARPYTKGGLATFLGLTLEQLWRYKNKKRGDDDEMKEQFHHLLSMADQVIETSKEEMALIGIYNAAFAQFDLKHSHGWSDKQEVDHTSSDGSMHVRRTVVDPEPDPEHPDEGQPEQDYETPDDGE